MTDADVQATAARGAAAEIGPLVGAVYQTAAPAERRRLIEHLMRPLGLLSMAAVAGGVFTAIRLRTGWDSMQVRLEDTLNIGATEVSALADMVQQVDADSLDGLARMLMGSPALAGTTAAVLLLRALQVRRNARPGQTPI